MAVGIENTNGTYVTSGTSLSFSITLGGASTTRGVFFFVFSSASITAVSVKLGGVSAAQVKPVLTYLSMQLYFLATALTGAQTVAVTWTTSAFTTVAAVSATGVNATNPYLNFNLGGQPVSISNVSIPLTANKGDLTLTAMYTSNTQTPTTNQNQIYQVANGSFMTTVDYGPGTLNPTHNWTYTGGASSVHFLAITIVNVQDTNNGLPSLGPLQRALNTTLTTSLALTNNPQQGNLIIAMVALEDASNTKIISITDGNGNPFVLSSGFSGQFGYMWCGYMLSAPANANKTITAKFPNAVTSIDFFVVEIPLSNIYYATFDQVVAGTASPTTNPVATPTITPAQAFEFIYGTSDGWSTGVGGGWQTGGLSLDVNENPDCYITSSSTSAIAPCFIADLSITSPSYNDLIFAAFKITPISQGLTAGIKVLIQ